MAKPLSSEQRSWLKELGSLVGGTSEDVAVVADEAGPEALDGAAGGKGGDKALVGAAAFVPELEVLPHDDLPHVTGTRHSLDELGRCHPSELPGEVEDDDIVRARVL